MSTEETIPPESAIVEVNPETTDLVKQETSDPSDDVIKETIALFEAIKKRTEQEWQTASDLIQESYLKAVSQAQNVLEQNQTEAKERMEQTSQLVQKEADKNWQTFEALRTKAMEMTKEWSELSREKYLESVRQARESVEQNKLIEKERVEQTVQDLQQQTDKNWQGFVSEIESLGTQLTDAAKKAWNDLIASIPKD
ncbi:hypothetical protein IQ264_28845 [Phormidium sp. LEGE 05292]|uniref:hypothetical protein n=1 Tax=[Phormidium] sp. LEGE 05292 TaxID=767427 RepID=UPI0018801609|nr:hypothetical protein [Phormidium sp. LEGE 05292]MBE9229417.1 hypothetical protein [Phormidium sp. LEGE 05292]